MMLKGKYLYACLAAGVFLSVPLLAEARLASNGVSFNGVSFNGVSFNGVSFNGVSFNGTDLNTNQITPAVTQASVRVEGGQLVIQTSPIAR